MEQNKHTNHITPTLSLSACLEHRNIVGIGFACLCYNGMEVHGVQEPSIYAFLGIKVAVNNICLDVTWSIESSEGSAACWTKASCIRNVRIDTP